MYIDILSSRVPSSPGTPYHQLYVKSTPLTSSRQGQGPSPYQCYPRCKYVNSVFNCIYDLLLAVQKGNARRVNTQYRVQKKWMLCFNHRKCWFLVLDIPETEFIICCTCAVLNRHLLKVCRRNDIFKQKMQHKATQDLMSSALAMFRTKTSHGDIKKSAQKVSDHKKDSIARLKHLRLVIGAEII